MDEDGGTRRDEEGRGGTRRDQEGLGGTKRDEKGGGWMAGKGTIDACRHPSDHPTTTRADHGPRKK
jgi:hypothetical protein